MKQNRPVNLKLTSIKLPITAIVSILHRISGIVLFLFIPYFIWMLQQIYGSSADFALLSAVLQSPLGSIALFLSVGALIYHMVMGVRHLLMDVGCFEQKCSAKWAAYISLMLFVALFALLGVWIWVW